MSRKLIQDEYTALEISKQRKHQLRNPDKEAERRKRWRQSEAGRASIKTINQRQYEKRKLSELSTSKVLDNND